MEFVTASDKHCMKGNVLETLTNSQEVIIQTYISFHLKIFIIIF